MTPTQWHQYIYISLPDEPFTDKILNQAERVLLAYCRKRHIKLRKIKFWMGDKDDPLREKVVGISHWYDHQYDPLREPDLSNRRIIRVERQR